MKRFFAAILICTNLSACATFNSAEPCAMADREITHANLLENSMGEFYELCLAEIRKGISQEMVK